MSSPPPLPPGFTPLRRLSDRPGEEVWLAAGDHGPVVLRLGAGGRSELAALARLDHPGLVRLLAHGHDPITGTPWLARSFVEGDPLGPWARGRPAEELGALVAGLLPALQHLHEQGLVHGDLKPDNVLVDAEARPHLTDFGLSRRTGAEGRGGSLFFVAPEVLHGAPLGPAADLFAVGVLLHALLTGAEVTAEAYYARFPREDHLAATGTRPEDLPGWARGLVCALLERDPAARPPSASAVERDLRARLGLPPPSAAEDLRRRRLAWTPLLGREAATLEALEEGPPEALLIAPAGDDPLELVEDLRLRLALGGTPAHRAMPEDLGLDSPDLETFAARALEAGGSEWLLVPVREGQAADAPRLAHLIRAAAQRRGRAPGETPRVLGVLAGEPPMSLEGVARTPLPPLRLADLEAALCRDLGPGTVPLARPLHRASGGATTRARRLLEARLRRGDLVDSPRGAQLRPGAPADRWDLDGEVRSRLAALGPGARRLLLALELLDGRAGLGELVPLAGGRPGAVERRLRELALAGELRLERSPAGELRARRDRRDRAALEALLPRELRRRLHAALAAGPGAAGRTPLHRYASAPDTASRTGIEEALDDLDAGGRPEELLELAEQWARLAAEFAPQDRHRAAAAVARAWTRLGQPGRAEEVLEALPAAPEEASRAAEERARAAIASARGEADAALEHLEHAARLDPADGGAALAQRALLLHGRGDLDGVEATVSEARRRPGGLAPRPAFNLATLEALTLERRGGTEEALALHGELVESARRAGDPEREARARLNLGLLLRRIGRLDLAGQELERTLALEERRGHLPGLAQARAMLGSVRRSQGRLAEAAALLGSARELRERLGDLAGARSAAGMLGLVHADRGALRAALDELASAAEGIDAGRRPGDAALLEARLVELRARIGSGAARAAGDREPAGDPRVLLGHARAAALSGEPRRAAALAERARDLAARLGHAAGEAGAVVLLAALGESPWPSRLSPDLAPRELAEAELHARLRRTRDAAEPERDLERARALADAGHLDLAARLAVRVIALSTEEGTRQQALSLARAALEEVERGLTAAEAAHARERLAGLPDPAPAELGALAEALRSGVTADRDLRELLEINRRLVEQEDQRSLVAEIVLSALRVTRAERGFLILEEGGELAFDVARDSSQGPLEDPSRLVSSSVLRQVFEGGRTVRLSDAGADPLLGGAPSIEALDLRSILVAPFRVDGELQGAIYVDHRLREGAFGERAEELLELLASQAALALRQVRRLAEIRGLNDELADRVRRREADLAQARRTLARVGGEEPLGELVGSSEAMSRVRAALRRAAPARLPVLVHGPSGTGKELAARALHRLGPRQEGPLVAENCAALPASLIESELFGYRKGAFTGADRDRAGIFERAHTGTLFLDEIGELPLELQAKLLRVLETHEVRRLGDSRTLSTDFRLVAATNRDLAAEVAAGRFRADLFYRLDALRIELPPLEQRLEDVPELVGHFLRLEAGDGEPRGVSRAVLSALSRRAWPGNVRELSNEVARLCVLSEGDLEDPSLVRVPAGGAPAPPTEMAEIVPIAELERRAILAALEATGDDKRRAAEKLGISRAKLYQRLKQWTEEGGAA